MQQHIKKLCVYNLDLMSPDACFYSLGLLHCFYTLPASHCTILNQLVYCIKYQRLLYNSACHNELFVSKPLVTHRRRGQS
jgi:hypothetical protein